METRTSTGYGKTSTSPSGSTNIASATTFAAPSTSSLMVQIPQTDRNTFLRLQSTLLGACAATDISSSTNDAYIASSSQPYVIDSGVFFHMIGIRDKFT